MKLTVLGCGDAFASEGRFNTSFLLSENKRNVLIDCGASTMIRLKQENISPLSIDHIVITHFHGDHYGGLPFFIISSYVELKRATPFTIIGPGGIQQKVYALQEALYPGSSSMIDELNVQFLEYADGKSIESDGLVVYGRKVSHAPQSNPHAVKLYWQGKVFGFSGDTEWHDALIDIANDTDVFVIECNNLYHDSPGHLSYQTIVDKSPLFATKKLLLTHMGSLVINAPNLDIDQMTDGMQLEF